jgi:DNA repair protein RadC
MSNNHHTSSSSSLLVRDAQGDYRLATGDEVLTAARQVLGHRVRRGTDVLTSPQAVRDLLRMKLGSLEHEVFVVLLLDAQHRLVRYVELFRGTLGQTSVYPREVVKIGLQHNAAAMIFAHNHPSGVTAPSRADELLTQSLKSALALVDVRVLDHFVVAGAEILSFAERGLL